MTLGDPDVAVGWVRVRAAVEEDQLSGVDGEHLAGPQALSCVHLQIVGAICRFGATLQFDAWTDCSGLMTINHK